MAAIAALTIAAMSFQILAWSHLPVFWSALVLLPGMLTNLVVIRGPEVSVVRIVGCVPYWRHRVPGDARFDLFEAWEDPAPTGVAFEARSYGADPLHLGTGTSARALYEHIGTALSSAGWKRGSLGYERPGAVRADVTR
jgi:hypothetical protein